VDRFADGEMILDPFRNPSVEVFVVLEGRVQLWNDADTPADGPPATCSTSWALMEHVERAQQRFNEEFR